MRKKLAILVTLAMLISLLAVPAYGAELTAPTVYLDGKCIDSLFDVKPVIDNGRTLVPLRAIFEAMGATVTWDAETRTASAVKGDTKVILPIGSTEPTINGVVKKLDVPAKIVNDRTLAPLRFVGEAFGGTVDWDGATRTITITSAAVSAPAPEPEPAPAPEPEPAPAPEPEPVSAPSSAADVVKGAIAAFEPINAELDFTGAVTGTPFGDINAALNGSAKIDEGKAESANFFADLGALGSGDRTADACPFSEIIAGPEADGLKLAGEGALSEEGNYYVITLKGVTCPQSIIGVFNKACDMVSIDFSLNMDCQIKVNKDCGHVEAVDNIVLKGKASTALGAYDSNFQGNISYSH